MEGFNKVVAMQYVTVHRYVPPLICQGRIQGGLWGLKTPLQKYIREAKRMMYWYKNTLKCIIS